MSRSRSEKLELVGVNIGEDRVGDSGSDAGLASDGGGDRGGNEPISVLL